MAPLAAVNAARWDKAKLTRNLKAVATNLVANKPRYQTVSAKTGVPWFVIAVIHQRESSANFSGVLHNGEAIIGTGRQTRLVPKGRGPFATWGDAAVDALKNCHPYAAKNRDWSVGGTLAKLEEYNGLGYSRMGKPSPYIWAGTDQYVRGKYIADHVYDPNHVDTQPGCAALIMTMMALDPTIAFGKKPVIPPAVTKATVPAAAAAGLAVWQYGLIGAAVVAAIAVGVFVYLKYFRKP